MAKGKRSRPNWVKTLDGRGCGDQWSHPNGWRVIHCGHPTANYPWYGHGPNDETMLSGGINLGMAFQYLTDAQIACENHKEDEVDGRNTKLEGKLWCAFVSGVPNKLLEDLRRVPAEAIDMGSDSVRLRWQTKDGRYLSADNYGKGTWQLSEEGVIKKQSVGGNMGSCMSAKRIREYAAAIIKENKQLMEWINGSRPSASVPDMYEDSARIVISNALVAARKSGYRISRVDCIRCVPKGSVSRCMPCAVAEFCELDSALLVEDELARIFAVPYDWVLALIGGFDGDKDSYEHPTALQLGRTLWRKYGTKTKRS